MKNKKQHWIIIFALIVAWGSITFYKFGIKGYTFKSFIPIQSYSVAVATVARSNGGDISISHFIPENGIGQSIEQVTNSGNFSNFKQEQDKDNQMIRYNYTQNNGEIYSNYSFIFIPKNISYHIDSTLRISSLPIDTMQTYLKATKLIQSNDSIIAQRIDSLGLTDEQNVLKVINTIFDYTNKGITKTNFSGETDALLAEKLQEASCNGKSRLMVALLRAKGIPSRLVGGVIMSEGSKRTSHQWVEVQVGNIWVPYCPLNGYRAEKPSNYLKMYTGDEVMFAHTKNINFDYKFRIKKVLLPRQRETAIVSSFELTNLWQMYAQAGIPLNLLKIILIVPIGALVTIIFRNCFGVQTFGTFLPALIAASFMDTGLFWGIAIFSSIIVVGAFVNFLLSKLNLLHTPKLTVIMVVVVSLLLLYAFIGIKIGQDEIARSILFPLAIITITTERFFLFVINDGTVKALKVLGSSMVVVAFTYMVMSSVFLQTMLIVLPETFLIIVVFSIYLGRWTGIRLSELFRFRKIIGGSHVS